MISRQSPLLAFGTCALLATTACSLERDAGPTTQPTTSEVPPAQRAVLSFDGVAEAGKGISITYHEPSGTRDLATLPYGIGSSEVYLHTVVSQWELGGPIGGCGSGQLCALVSVRNGFAGAVLNVNVVIDTISGTGVTSTGPWSYETVPASSESAPLVWVFDDPGGANFNFTGHVEGDTTTDAGTPDAAGADACAGGFAGIDGGTANIPVTSCRAITTPGNYLVNTDLSLNSLCLNIHDTSNVHIECNGHTVSGIPSISVSNVTGFEMSHCLLATINTAVPMYITSVSQGALHDGTIAATDTLIQTSDHFYVYDNQFAGVVQHTSSSDDYIACNSIVAPNPMYTTSTVLLSAGGARNTLTRNTVNGMWDGTRLPTVSQAGSDDGIFLTEEDGDIVSYNTISNNWDCGIETKETITDTVFSNNTILNSGFCGIGGWYFNGWARNVVSGNVITQAQIPFAFFRDYGVLAPQTAVEFHDNTFLGNHFSQPDYIWTNVVNMQVYSNMAYSGMLSGGGNTQPSQYLLANNSFQGNDFDSTQPAPNFGTGPIVPGYVIDLGGNECQTPSIDGYPLSCAP